MGGTAQYASDMEPRYWIGCSSLHSKDPAEGWQLYRRPEGHRGSPEFETEPTAARVASTEQRGRPAQPSSPSEGLSLRTSPPIQVKVLRLPKTSSVSGARACGLPAWKRNFGAIDLLASLDLRLIPPPARNRVLPPPTT
jgi:hypothetical protein